MGREKRRFRRAEFETRGTATHGRTVVAFSVINLSLKGALVNPDDSDAFPLGTTVSLSIELPGSDLTIVADAEYIHREYEYLGFRFVLVDIESIPHLRRLVELNAPDDGDIIDELPFLYNG